MAGMGQECFSQVANKMTRSNKLQQGKSQLDIKNKFLLVNVINRWRRFSRNLVESLPLGFFRIWLPKALHTWFKPEVLL